MKVALCTFGFPEFTVSLARALIAHSCRPIVYLPQEMKDFCSGLEDVVTFPYRLTNNPFSKFRACSRLTYELYRTKPDVIHFQGWSPLLSPYLAILRRFPIVYTWHDPVPHVGDESWAMDLTQRLLILSSRRVVTLTNAMRDTALRVFPPVRSRIAVIPHGIYDCYVSGAEERPAQLKPDDKFILLFGRVAPYKGAEDLCAAFSATSLKSEYRLVIAGKPNYRVKTPAELGESLVFLDRYIPADQVRYLFRHCSMVVLPYHDATQSGVLMLAYAFGKPVLCTDVGGVSEMVRNGETGMVIPARDQQALARSLERALGDPGWLESTGERGLAFATKNFNWDVIAERTAALYREVLRQRARE
jgi:glycosyltransferase involved in cell wall biosynthesis